MSNISRIRIDVKSRTCATCVHGHYHPARPADNEGPAEPSYWHCRHPRIVCAGWVPDEQPEFQCRWHQDADNGCGPDCEMYHDLLASGFDRQTAAEVVDYGYYTAAQWAAEWGCER